MIIPKTLLQLSFSKRQPLLSSFTGPILSAMKFFSDLEDDSRRLGMFYVLIMWLLASVSALHIALASSTDAVKLMALQQRITDSIK